ncbi:MAG: acyltransferase, partial [Bryobacteraceae bacterium]
TPFFRLMRGAIKRCMHANLPQPAIVKPLFRFTYELRAVIWRTLNGAVTFFYREPLFRARCEQAGKRLNLMCLPEVYGHTRIYLGDDVFLNGKIGIDSGRFFDEPRLVIKDRAAIGHHTFFSVNREVVIEEDVIIANECVISDNDGHPRQADLRAANAALDARDIQPVRICRSAWLGRGVCVMKGVTIGEGAIIGARSVVISDIPPYAIAMGNPAEVILRGAGRPRRKTEPQIQRASVAPQE